ncbi:YebC/PmpR family DNA-binding transcriptional regulator [Candidatus Saccharibacteria bacterium]|nr:YebC/PmpR family DNA-binding transcriptional regulator [Candidatus Saccharibacteria bacterium]MCB9820984.1 YebC/PmpR family DNA-binding transcriptional regulator [Candidatus Nomurabacteria bacterium]
MAGHSKWAKIKRDKAGNDAKKGAVFTKIGNQIAVAARSGTDPLTNPALATVIETAKAANMPLINIEKAIKRAEDKSAAALEEVLYEGYAQGGVAVLVECATDNRNRTFPEVKNAFNKNGGSIADPGSVAFQFERKGLIVVEASGDDATLTALEAGAIDVNEEDGELYVYTDPKDLHAVRQSIINAGLKVASAELVYEPNAVVQISDQAQADKIQKLLDAVDDLEDVVSVHTNFYPV